MSTTQRAVIAAMALALHVSETASCPAGVTAPSVTTVMVSKEDPEKAVWVVATDCTYTTVTLNQVGGLSFSADSGIERIAGVPSGTTRLSINAKLSRGADLSASKKMTLIAINNFEGGLLDDFKFPSEVEALSLVDGSGTSVDKLNLPDSITDLFFESMGLSSLKKFPSGLTDLVLSGNKFSSINFAIPSKLKTLTMSENPLSKLERVTFPDTLTIFTCVSCGLSTIRGVKWSSKLSILRLASNPIREFELRQSDFDVLSKLSTLTLVTTDVACSDEEAEVKTLLNQKVCVISDERFESRYSGSGATKSPSSGSSDENTDSTSASKDDSANGDNSDSNSNSTRSSTGSNGGGSGLVGSNGEPLDGENGSSAANRGDGTNESKDANGTTSSSVSTTLLGILIAVSSVFGIILAVIAFRRFRTHRQNRDKAGGDTTGNTMMLVDTPGFGSSLGGAASSVGGSSQEYLSNDIRNDKAIIPYRIDEKRIVLSKQIARGGFGIIFRGVYNDRAVAVKQMLPDAWRNGTHLISFMDEIRLCASLSHPKIVEFVGVAWTSLRDISVISEFMAGGDLSAVLHRHAQSQSLSSATASSSSSSAFEPSPREWSEPWTAAAINSKTRIAKDVSEAIVYLHSFSNPIIHRDLKARNVLLDTRGNAKLSDFGISREMTVDETMTSEVGTSAWIAPEVLRGDRYSERADMYSFGVLLVELDKCRHPYAGEDSLVLMDGSTVQMAPMELPGRRAVRDTQSQATHRNMQIAMLVSAGHLRPKPSATCPSRIQALIDWCLSFAPEDRPSAMQVHYELRQIAAAS